MNYQTIYDQLIALSNQFYEKASNSAELDNYYYGRVNAYEHCADLIEEAAHALKMPILIRFTNHELDIEAARREEALAEAFSKTREVWDE